MIQNIQQLREEFKSKLSRLNDYLWTAGLPDPMTRIQQISFFFFLKMLEEQDIAKEKEEKLTGRKHHSVFAGEKDKFRWSRWREKAGKDLYEFVRDKVFPFVEELHNSHKGIGQIFHGAKLRIDDPPVLKRTIELIDTIDFSSLDTDIKGDLYESLLSSIESAGELGAFLTPRHIIRAIVEMVNPKIGEAIFDPACGSAGFLITAYEWLKFKNSDPKNTDAWIGTGMGRSGVGLNLVISKKYARTEIFINRGDKGENKKVFDYPYNLKDEIEKEFGDKLTWERMEDNVTSRIKYQLDGVSVNNEEDWPKMNEFIIDSAERMHRAFKDPIRKMKS